MPQKIGETTSVSPSRQCSSTLVSFGQGFFLTKNNVKTLQHTPYSLNLAPVDFYLFPQLKSALKGWHFCGATNIIKNVMEELKRLSQKGLQEYFQSFLIAGRSV